MELRTTIDILPSSSKITYDDKAMFIGSCFASSIGSQMVIGHMPVMINPAGAVFNPVSVCNTLDTIIERKEFVQDDLYNHEGTYLSFSHYTDFSSDNPEIVLEKINRKSNEAFEFLKGSRFLFITFGTARVYRFKKTGQIVSNCHKIPPDYFEAELLTVAEVVTLWKKYLDRLHSLFPQLNIVFTISPVRHWKDGAYGNQVSKSVLFLAVEELLKHSVSPGYFPAYELVMDDLRDYRFYSEDMLHPSTIAINYIWDSFSGCYMESKTMNIWKEIVKISKACSHRITNTPSVKVNDFAMRILNQISDIEEKVPSIDLSSERKYFRNLLNK
ncbi:MAG TPA: GSCFA domain-containing protein [Bacteroidales bacterium]|nr:GSCFA domain-containing protein [Bacteroidales bacterium]